MSQDTDSGADQRSRVEIADLLRRRIDAGDYPVNERLPSYRELAKSLGAAPNTVGEAVRLLAAEGRVRIRRNAGAVVCDPSERPTTVEEQVQEARAGLLDVQDQLRTVRQAVDALEDAVSDLIGRLPKS
ncbi:winged helix-turn-helix domain-containing protein [Saccharothrix sp. NPDC042600]|uniref:winged helix-turn-helix domain-containing protein n=1 Tax=Saccharothrix TaxID=2071 RepID=UPI0033E10B6D|nr:hypothetical protein GCM10017745_67110 [Saccharothrix mutabilis subsp. capreolus]